MPPNPKQMPLGLAAMMAPFAEAGLQPQIILKQINIPSKAQKRKISDDAASTAYGKVDGREDERKITKSYFSDRSVFLDESPRLSRRLLPEIVLEALLLSNQPQSNETS